MVNILKKTIAALLTAAALFSVTGCTGNIASSPAQADASSASSAQTSSSAASTDTSSSQNDSTSSDPVRIATKPMTEQFILGEMLALLIETHTDYTVEVTKGIGGGTSNIHPAMEKGEFDLYPEYTSSGWVLVLDHEAKSMADDELFQNLKKEYEEKFGMTWLGLYGFNNTYTVAVREEVAAQHNLKTTSDLAAVAGELNFGGNPDYIEREDGFPLLCETYGLSFKSVSDIDIGLKYQALASGDIDVTNAFTTDAQLGNPNASIVVLADDLALQANYFCSTVVRQDALTKFPDLEEALSKMDGAVSDQEMAQLNYQVEVEGLDERDAAQAFLTQKGLL